MTPKKTAVAVEAAPSSNPLVFQYAKAIVGFIIAEAAVLGLWAATLPDTGPITRKLWIALGIAAVGPLGAAFGVAVTTNAKPTDSEAGQAPVEALVVVALLILILLAVLFGWSVH